MSIPFTDKERFTKFLEILPEEDFDDFLNRELYNLRYSSSYFKQIEKVLLQSKSITSKFTDSGTNKKYLEFTIILKELRDFLIKNFKENYPGDGYYLPLEELDHTKVKDELDSIREAVEKTYKDFIQSTNDTLSLTTEEKLDSSITKGKKRITLPHFGPTDWSKITIRFITEQEVYIETGKGDAKQSDYQSLGFSNDKSNKPNKAWDLLLLLAISNGEIQLEKPIPDSVKQHKMYVSNCLKKIFKNNDDPFYYLKETQTYKIKVKLIPPEMGVISSDEYGTQEYLNSKMVSVYESENTQDKNDQ